MMKKLGVLLLASAATLAQAQDKCVLPTDADLLATDRAEPVQANQLPVDEYLLALSWSPNYCATARGKPDAAFQCERNAFTWVVHGLWPGSTQARQVSDEPGFCAVAAPIAPATLRQHLCTVPGARLMSHEWAKHGTCGFANPEAYFAQTETLRGKLKLPDPQKLGKGGSITVGQLRTAFVALNPDLPPAALMVAADRKQRLSEVRICYDKQFRYISCDARGAPDRLPLKVTPVGR